MIQRRELSSVKKIGEALDEFEEVVREGEILVVPYEGNVKMFPVTKIGIGDRSKGRCIDFSEAKFYTYTDVGISIIGRFAFRIREGTYSLNIRYAVLQHDFSPEYKFLEGGPFKKDYEEAVREKIEKMNEDEKDILLRKYFRVD